MHGEQLVIHFRGQDGLIRAGQLDAHDQRFHAADDEQNKCGDKIPLADFLVIYGS